MQIAEICNVYIVTRMTEKTSILEIFLTPYPFCFLRFFNEISVTWPKKNYEYLYIYFICVLCSRVQSAFQKCKLMYSSSNEKKKLDGRWNPK